MWGRRLAALLCSSSNSNSLRPRGSASAFPSGLLCRSSSPSLFSTSAREVEAGMARGGGAGVNGGARKKSFARKAIPIVLLSLTGGAALSAVNDLAIFHGCSSKAIEKAGQNQKIVEALGEPILRGPWYDASLAVGHRRHSVSCTFPVSGPHGTGIFQLKAVRGGEDGWFSFLKHHDWDILVMEALLHVPSNEEKNRTFRISLTDGISLPAPVECKDCVSSEQHGTDER